MLFLIAGFSIATQLTPDLASLELQFTKATEKQEWHPDQLQNINCTVLDWVDQNKFTEPAECARAAAILTDFRYRFNFSRVRYELSLVGLVAGDQKARGLVADTWDAVMTSVGRPRRIQSFGKSADPRFRLVAGPSSIVAVYRDPDLATKRAQTSKDNQEAMELCAEDQKVRKTDWSKLSRDQMKAIRVGDEARKHRILKLLTAGKIVTANDFDHASLVMQHGDYWEDYCVAHELSVCSLLLGQKSAAWLAAASYDRMLVSAGYPQRFGTQYSSELNQPISLDPIETVGINDSERKWMHCPTLEEAKNRKWD